MGTQTSACSFNQGWFLLLVLIMENTFAITRPINQNPAPPVDSSEQTITFYMNGATQNKPPLTTPITGNGASLPPPKSTGFFLPKSGAPLSQTDPIFSSQGPVGPSSSWLSILTHPHALEFGMVTVIDQEFHGVREFGLPLVGKVQGIYVTGLTDNSSHIVAMKASFADNNSEDCLRFFGMYHDDGDEPHIAVVGGTGRYEGANGVAVIKAVHRAAGGNDRLSKSVSVTVYLR